MMRPVNRSRSCCMFRPGSGESIRLSSIPKMSVVADTSHTLNRLTLVCALPRLAGIGVLPLTTQKKALVQQAVAYFLTGIAHGPIQIIPASVRCPPRLPHPNADVLALPSAFRH